MISFINLAVLFAAKVADNALSTTKTILVQRSRWILAGIAVIISDFIYFWITKRVVSADNELAMLVVAVAGGVGCSLACFINEKMSKDRTYVNVIMSDDLEEMKRLRDFLAQHHITNVASDSYTLDWNAKTISITAYPETKVVDANMVVKKKGNVEQEVQEGWKGHIIPFELIQSTILAEDSKAIKEKENRLSEITSEYEEILDTLSEEEKECDFVKEDSFVFAEINKALKSDSIEAETKEKLKSVAALNTEEKALKSAIKTESALLEKKTKDTIEGLSDEQVIELLKEKWIRPLIENLMQLPDSIVSELVSKLEALAKKYETTFAEVESQIEETEKSLSAMIDDLDGSEFDMLGLAELKKLLGGSAK